PLPFLFPPGLGRDGGRNLTDGAKQNRGDHTRSAEGGQGGNPEKIVQVCKPNGLSASTGGGSQATVAGEDEEDGHGSARARNAERGVRSFWSCQCRGPPSALG